jgi:dCTP deaminase
VRLARGDRLCQLRLARGDAALSGAELVRLYRETPLCFETGEPARPVPLEHVRIDAGGTLLLRVGLAGRDPCAWRARGRTATLQLAAEGAHDPRDFWEPVRAADGHCILEPGRFHLFASKERIRVPPEYAAEMQAVDLGIGELRNNYAGFFDSGFGWREQGGRALPGGTPAVLEVRAHDVPFLVEDGQVLFRLRFFRASGRPDRLYGEGRGSYVAQDLTLARCFRAS